MDENEKYKIKFSYNQKWQLILELLIFNNINYSIFYHNQ